MIFGIVARLIAVNRSIFALVILFSADYASFKIIPSASLAHVQSTSFNMWEMLDSNVCTRIWWLSIVLKDVLLFVGAIMMERHAFG